VLVRQREHDPFYWGHSPRSFASATRSQGVVLANSSFVKLAHPRATVLPLLPELRVIPITAWI
jgi:hypothetical protein